MLFFIGDFLSYTADLYHWLEIFLFHLLFILLPSQPPKKKDKIIKMEVKLDNSSNLEANSFEGWDSFQQFLCNIEHTSSRGSIQSNIFILPYHDFQSKINYS